MEQDQSHPKRVSPLVKEAGEAILRRLNIKPHLLILYGSEARGEATPESDIDLLVVLERLDPHVEDEVREAVYEIMWDDDFSRLISVFVLSREQFESQREKGYSFARDVERDGIVLWQAA